LTLLADELNAVHEILVRCAAMKRLGLRFECERYVDNLARINEILGEPLFGRCMAILRALIISANPEDAEVLVCHPVFTVL